MTGGTGPMMLPTPLSSPLSSHVSQVSRRLNTPEEDDETMSGSVQPHAAAAAAAAAMHRANDPPSDPRGPQRPLPSYHAATLSDFSLFSRQRLDRHLEHTHAAPHSSFCSSHAARSTPPGYGQPTPYPSRAEGGGGDGSSWLHPSMASSGSEYPNSLPSCLEESCLSRYKFHSLPGGQSAASSSSSTASSSLEQPLSLHSNPPSTEPRHHTLSPYACSPQGAACCAQCPADAFARAPKQKPWPHYRPANGGFYPGDCRLPPGGFTQISPFRETQPSSSTPLPLEQRRVFVTYEVDNEKHLNEIINFVALLRHNGFDTHIDLFEQQYRSISTIDFMERYLSEKEYLIIIIISPKYYETVTASPVGMDIDERTFNTVYIHKQLQNEFIQNGSKNFRFIPILFPGAKKCHVPTWLQNTNVFGWPRDRDDILRRLMRVEKYNPPPIGELPTIVSIPI